MKNPVEKIELKELLKTLKKDELMELTYIYPIKGKSKLKKEELINALYEIMISEETIKENTIIIGEAFKKIDEEKDKSNNVLLKIRKLCSIGYGKMTVANDNIKFTVADEADNFVIQDDIEEEILRYSLIKSYILSCIRLYGACELDFLIKLFDEQNPNEKPLDYKELNLQIDRCKKIGLEATRYADCVVSESLLMFEGDIEDLFNQREDKNFYIPTKEDLLKYEDEFYIEKNSQYMELEKFINKVVKDKEMAEGIMEDIAFPLRFHDITIDSAINEFNRRHISFESLKEVEKFAKLYVDLTNNTRCWANRGYTPKEISDNKKLNTIDKLEIGRNDKCPCKSGKKYKKCCMNKEVSYGKNI